MKYLLFTLSVFLVLLLQLPVVVAQTAVLPNDTANFPFWFQMMQDPEAKFSATVHAFEKYWENRPVTKGSGWKVFKRWEYINSSRVMPDGKLPAPGAVAKEYFRTCNAQKSVSGTWTQIGPVAMPSNATGQPNGLGRVNAVGFHPTDGNIIYVGSPSGGLWKTTDGGLTWTNLSAGMPTLGVSAVLVHPNQNGIIWIGTGDRDSGDAPGMGTYKSTDGGTTWAPANTGMGNQTVGMLIMHPADPNIMLAATSGGIYKTIDGGANWIRKSSNTNHYKDVRFKPGDPTIVYATESGKFYRSVNTGDNWTQITSGIITGTRMVIGVTPANPSYVYVMQTNGTFSGIMRSTDSGLNFTTQSTTPNIMDYACDGSGTSSQAGYDLCIAVDPADANILYLGGINIWKSTNGGSTLTINSHWVGSSWGTSCAPSVHADIHSLDFSPVNSKLYTGCDGGIYVTSNGGTTWIDISGGLGIAQIYKIGQSATNTALTMNGYQDNGTAFGNGTAFTTVIGGDGMECIIDYTNSNYRYGALYYGDIRRSSGGGYSTIAKNGVNGITESGGWVTPYILHETNPETMFVGYKNVWRSTNVKTGSPVSWTAVSTGETGNCIVLEQSPANVNTLYVVRSGQMKRTDNANDASVTWTSCTLPGGYTPTDLEAHPTNPDIVYATAQYGVYKSINKGANWTNISSNLPSIYTNCLVYDKNSNEGLYVGNETAIYYKDASLTDWLPFSSGLPVVDVRELEIYYNAATPASNKIKAATYGRGLWESDLIETGPANPSTFTASTASNTQINLSWAKNAANNNVMIVWSSTPIFGIPANGTAYVAGNSIPGGGTVLYVGSGTAQNHTGLIPATNYYYKVWSFNATNVYSTGITAASATFGPPVSAFSASSLTPVVAQTVTFTDETGFAPTGWTWTFSPNTITYTAGTSASSQNPQVQFTATGQYSVTLTTSNAYGSDPEIKTNYINVVPYVYCTPAYTSGTGDGDYITLVQLGTINNATGASASPFYTYYSSLSTNIIQNTAYTITLSPGTYTSGNNISVWIDYNQNGTFETTEKLGNVVVAATPATGTINFTVPATSSTGTTRMRVREVWNNSSFDACTTYAYGETEDYNINIVSLDRTLNLTVFLEGLFNGTVMNKAQNAGGNQFQGTVADQITVELRNSASPYSLAGGPYTINVNTDGTANVTIPGALNSSYYIVVHHRNSIETWSATHIPFTGTAVSYNFSTASSQAYGNNMKLISGKYVLYAGDTNQDGAVDGPDMISADNQAAVFGTGYIQEDINGDGSIDALDMIMLDNNAALFIQVVLP